MPTCYVEISKRQYLEPQTFSHCSMMSKSFLTSLKCINNVTHVNDAVWCHGVFVNSLNPCLILVFTRKTHPDMIEKLLTGTLRIKPNKKNKYK